MTKRLSFILIIVLTAAFHAGCSGGDSPEALSKDMTNNFTEMANILSGVTDEASARAAVPKIEAVRANMRQCAERAKKLPKPDEATERKITESTQAPMMEAIQKIAAAQERLATQPELLAIIEPAMRGMEDDL